MSQMRVGSYSFVVIGAALAALPAQAAGKHHVLKATPDTVQWGWLDPRAKPQLTIESGDTVSVETLMHGKDQIQPGVPMEKIWTGDSHCAQGNGEVNLTALECSFAEIVLQPIVHKGMKVNFPRIETKTHFISVGFDEDLNKAFNIALSETIDFLVEKKGLDKYEAYALAAMAADCRVSQVVDVRKGVHCMVPKALFTAAR